MAWPPRQCIWEAVWRGGRMLAVLLQGRSCFCLSGVLSPVMGFYNALSPACPNTLPERPTNPLLGGLDGAAIQFLAQYTHVKT